MCGSSVEAWLRHVEGLGPRSIRWGEIFLAPAGTELLA